MFQLGFVDLFFRDSQPADIEASARRSAPMRVWLPMARHTAGAVSIAERWVISSPVTDAQLRRV